ncbi:hypothetical protein K503DRAFT_785021 [Rhizopogon vinicolor AM-OR11-026]|uniref:Uncharacterized protein n=1 Tax=Rhizopogon vinicolor AM-OR11-026 TaxID=1314800 RepID=A0A1B7MSD5_9AGAM|nr:hypothetical protein K503DRAFT_785021 [Rhizopogon vinicolor AM-OR11-026]
MSRHALPTFILPAGVHKTLYQMADTFFYPVSDGPTSTGRGAAHSSDGSTTANDIEKAGYVVPLVHDVVLTLFSLLPPSTPGATMSVSCSLAVAHVLRTYAGLRADCHRYVSYSLPVLDDDAHFDVLLACNHWTPDIMASPRPSRWPASCLGAPAHVNSTLSLLRKLGHEMRGASGLLSSRRAAVGLGSDEFGSPVV